MSDGLVLYGIVVSRISTVFIDNILKSDTAEVFINDLVKSLPDVDSMTFRIMRTLIRIVFKAGNRRKAALRDLKNIRNSIFIRLFGKSVSALIASVSYKELRTVEHRHNLFKIFF